MRYNVQQIAKLVLLDYWQKTSTLAKLRGQRIPLSMEQAQERWAKDAVEYVTKCRSVGVNPLHNLEKTMQRAVLLGHIKLPMLSVVSVSASGEDKYGEEIKTLVKERIRADLVKVTGASENLRVMFGDVIWTPAVVNAALRNIITDPVVRASYCNFASGEITDQAKLAFMQAPDVYQKMLSGVLHAVFLNMVTADDGRT